jgi:hypothetical protein
MHDKKFENIINLIVKIYFLGLYSNMISSE